MNQRAKIARHYQVRLLVIGLLALFGGLYFLYDGLIGYPHEQSMYLEYTKVKDAYPEDYNQRWVDVARERGWSEQVPEYKSDMDILTQKIIAGILIPIGVLILLRLLLNRGRWVAMDEQGLTDHSGRSVAFDAITDVDESRWQRKGIAVVHYKTNGQDGRLVLDDWKFDRGAISAMVKHLRQIRSPQDEQTQESQDLQEA